MVPCASPWGYFFFLATVRASAESELVKAEKQVAFWYYGGEHGFMSNKILAYSPTNAGLAWERTLAFLHQIGRSA